MAQARGSSTPLTTSGDLVKRLVTGGVLDAPWGIALAPASFGRFSNDLLSETLAMAASTPSTRAARIKAR